MKELGDSLSSICYFDDEDFKVAVYNAGVVLGYLFVIKVDTPTKVSPYQLRSAGGGICGRFAFAVYFPNSTATALLSCTRGVLSARAKSLYSHLKYMVTGTELCGFSLKEPREHFPVGCVKLDFDRAVELAYLRGMVRDVVADAHELAPSGVCIGSVLDSAIADHSAPLL